MHIFVIIITYNRIIANVTSCGNYITHIGLRLGYILSLTDYMAKLDMDKWYFEI